MTQRLNPEIKQLWLDALRSGNYEQGTHTLRAGNNKYCCLGVLCDLAEKNGVVAADYSVDYSKERYFYKSIANGADYSSARLPHVVAEWAMGDSMQINPLVNGQHLTALNDNGRSFEEIARLIETYL